MQKSLKLLAYSYIFFQVRMNTIATRLVYSPIPFTEFRPDVVARGPRDNRKEGTLEIHRASGHFNPYNMRHISFYTSDFFAGLLV